MTSQEQAKSDTTDAQIKIETIKWHQRIQEIAYIEAGQHMRALNQLMWQVPSLVIVINGGLWYGTTLVSELATRAIFFMIAVFDLLSIVTLYRLRGLLEAKIKFQNKIEDECAHGLLKKLSLDTLGDIYNQHLEEKKEKEKEKEKKSCLSNLFEWFFKFVSSHSKGNYTVIGCWSTVLLLCAIISIIGLSCPKAFLDKQEKSQTYEIKNLKNGDILRIEKK
jgi:hypothetical protein